MLPWGFINVHSGSHQLNLDSLIPWNDQWCCPTWGPVDVFAVCVVIIIKYFYSKYL